MVIEDEDIDKSKTVRQRIIDLLKVRTWDTQGLSRALGISQRQVEGHLKHVIRSVEAQGLRLTVHPSRCNHCSFEFSERSRSTKPSRCPQCRREQIIPALYCIEG